MLVPRNTPALTGNTLCTEQDRSGIQKHPRSHGEYSTSSSLAIAMLETPPLSRGILISIYITFQQLRNTPALTGNTFADKTFIIVSEKHPRSHGEYSFLPSVIKAIWETPPLSRGIPRVTISLDDVDRNTPALTGNTLPQSASTPISEKHPRSHGEYSTSMFRAKREVETPPLSRGILLIRFEQGTQKHPRSHGEYAGRIASRLEISETPPLSRGIRQQ